MIRVYHIKDNDAGSAVTRAITARRAALIRAAWLDGEYELVATCDTSDLEAAWSMTNNVDSSWSLRPADGVVPAEPTFYVHDGKWKVGRRSSMVGDVFELDNVLHVVASCGFELMGEVG